MTRKQRCPWLRFEQQQQKNVTRNTRKKSKMAAGEAASQSLRVVPPELKEVLLPRKANSLARKTFKRISSTGSLQAVGSLHSRPAGGSTKLTARRRSLKGGEDLRSLKEGEDLNQDVNLQDGSSKPPSNAGRNTSAKIGWQLKKVPTTSDILKLSHKTDCSQVFEIDLHGHDLNVGPDLKDFLKLKILDLSGNHIKKIPVLDSNKELKEVKFYDNEISAIAGLDNLKELCSLQLQHNQIVKIGRGLIHLKKLQSLRLDNNQIVRLEISELVSCSSITTLDLSHNRLESLGPLNYLPNLVELTAAGNQIKETGDITNCKKLEEVDLSRNQITDLSGLANLPNIQIMDVSHNQISSVTSVGKLRSVEELNMNQNLLTELSSFVVQFPKLQILSVCNNNITSLQQVGSLSGCLELVELSVAGNPFVLEHGEMTDCHHHHYTMSEIGNHVEMTDHQHQMISAALPNLEVIDGTQLKKSQVKQDIAPVMRTMSASSMISIHSVNSQLKAAAEEYDSIFQSITEKFDSLRELVYQLPAHTQTTASETQLTTVDKHLTPSGTWPTAAEAQPMTAESWPTTAGSMCTLTSSRCSSRSRLRRAQSFAAEHFCEGSGENK